MLSFAYLPVVMVEKLNEALLTYKIPLVICLVGLVLIIGGLVAPNLTHSKVIPKESLINKGDLTPDKIKINLSGAVVNPGVYTLNSSDRIDDALKAAGGFAEQANRTYISKVLNLSQKLTDGIKIYIPFQDENTPSNLTSIPNSQGSAVSGFIGINSGTQAQLESLPGIGPVTAAKIINSRPFGEVADLLYRKVVSKKVYDQIQNLVDLN